MGLNLRTVFIELRCRGGVFACARQLPVILKRFGFKRGFKYAYRWIKRNDYQSWISQYDVLDQSAQNRIRQQINGFQSQPKILIVLAVDSTPLAFLEEAIESIRSQYYENWVLCIAYNASADPKVRVLLENLAGTDNRIKVLFNAQRGTIADACNSALVLASADFVAFLGAADRLPQQALFYIAKRIAEHPAAAVIYTDEDKISAQGERYDPWFKCDFNYELLLAQNTIGHLTAYRRDLVVNAQGFNPEFEGAHEYDLALRVLEKIAPAQVVHVPRVLCHRRTHHGAIDPATHLARRSVVAHLVRTGRGGEVTPAPEAPRFNRVRYPLPPVLPLVSIIIPTRDKADLLGMCLDGLLEKTTYDNYEIIIVDNGSVEASTQTLFERLPQERVTVIRDDLPFNYSRLNNLAVRQAKGSVICLMNNDIEILSPNWLEEMLSFVCQPDIGCVGARLWFPDGRLQHAGVITGLGGLAGHPNKYFPRGHLGYAARAVLAQSLSAVTAACLMVRRELWEQTQGLDETLAIAYNDVDFCLRVQAAGYRNVWTPYAEMNHHESASRGNETTPEKQARYEEETNRMKTRWGEALINDPAYSPNLTLSHDDFSLAWPPRLTA